ncbi:MAG: efflux RND transporter periplasmic adaptor subunit [Pseudomonadota bacterium]
MSCRTRLNNNKNIHRVLTWSGLILAAVLVGCGKGEEQGGGMPGMFGGPAAVTAVTMEAKTVPLVLEYPAQVAGSREVEVRARVSGILLKRNYVEGERVKAGQTLFILDDAGYQAVLDRAAADLAAAEARMVQANREAVRLKPLFDADGAVSQKEYDDAVSNQAILAADVMAAKARLKEARLDLDRTRVEAPISGIAGRALPSEGTLITGPEILLTRVMQLDPVHLIFGIPDNDRLTLRQAVETGHVTWPGRGRFKVSVLFADGSESPKQGVVDFTDVRVNPETGTSEARAELANPNGLLQAGQFVRVRLSGAVRKGVFTVPQRALQEGPQGKYVYLINAENKAEIRPVQVAEWNGKDWVITGGLKAGDQVIVDGTMKIGPGAPVQTGGSQAPGAAPPAAQGSAPTQAGDAKAPADAQQGNKWWKGSAGGDSGQKQ